MLPKRPIEIALAVFALLSLCMATQVRAEPTSSTTTEPGGGGSPPGYYCNFTVPYVCNSCVNFSTGGSCRGANTGPGNSSIFWCDANGTSMCDNGVIVTYGGGQLYNTICGYPGTVVGSCSFNTVSCDIKLASPKPVSDTSAN